eukprot:gene8951-12125_t
MTLSSKITEPRSRGSFLPMESHHLTTTESAVPSKSSIHNTLSTALLSMDGADPYSPAPENNSNSKSSYCEAPGSVMSIRQPHPARTQTAGSRRRSANRNFPIMMVTSRTVMSSMQMNGTQLPAHADPVDCLDISVMEKLSAVANGKGFKVRGSDILADEGLAY